MRYMIHYPRNFANEYTIYVGSSADLDRLAEILASQRHAENSRSERITRREAIRLGISRPRQAHRDGEQWFGGFAWSGGDYWDTTTDAQIVDAAKATKAKIIEAEAAEDAWKFARSIEFNFA